MKRPSSPLVWLCAAGAAALGVLTVCDPTGIYAGYVASLDRETPVIAAAFTAAQEGVYPWSAPEAVEDAPHSPAYRPITETVTDDEMRSSVGNEEPFPVGSVAREGDPASAASMSAPARDTADAAAEPDAGSAGENAPASVAAPVSAPAGFVPVDASWFNDALFIGDSHIEGFCDYGGLPNATYYFKRGLDIWSVMNKPFVGGKLTIPQALEDRKFGKIYIMLGINEIGCGTTESYAAQYAKVVAQLRELQPDALIYIQAIFHTSQKKSDSSIYNNETINARNAAIAALADGQHVLFVDCNAVFDDENGALTPTYSGDGVHVKAPYYTMWRDYLMRFGLSGVATPDEPVDPGAPPVPVSTPAPRPAEPEAENAAESESAPAEAEQSAEDKRPVEAEPSAETKQPAEAPVGETDASAEPAPETPAEPAEAVPETPAEPAEAVPETPEPAPESTPAPDASADA